jgi:hypothetical protein
MDPNATLKHIDALVEEFANDSGYEDQAETAQRLIDAFDDLDSWLSKGGALPARWAR